MPVDTPSQNQSFGRTFVVAVAILGVVATAQLGAVTWALFTKPGAGLAGVDGDKPTPPPPQIDVSNFPVQEPPDDAPLAVNPDPINENGPSPIKPDTERLYPPTAKPVAVPMNPSPSTIATASPGNPLRPTPVPLSAFTPKQDPRFGELIEQGKILRNTGDTAGALVKFREAGLIDPTHPLPFAESAYTYEKMSLADKAGEQWRAILAMGENAGVYYSAAQAKLNVAMANTVRSVTPQPAAASAIPDGKHLAISTPRMEEDSDPASAKKFILHVPIRAKDGPSIAVRDMKVFVLFYEKINGKDIVRTTANVSNRWESPPIDWTEGEETLEVSYDLPPSDGRGEPRAYYGYIVRLYYQGELQDTQAQPASLNQKFPAEYQLSE